VIILVLPDTGKIWAYFMSVQTIAHLHNLQHTLILQACFYLIRSIEEVFYWKFLFRIKLPLPYLHQYKLNFHSGQRVNREKCINGMKNVQMKLGLSSEAKSQKDFP